MWYLIVNCSVVYAGIRQGAQNRKQGFKLGAGGNVRTQGKSQSFIMEKEAERGEGILYDDQCGKREKAKKGSPSLTMILLVPYVIY